MKRIIGFLVALALVVCPYFASTVLSITITDPYLHTWTPGDPDIMDLDHNYVYSWGINWTVPQGEIITGAVLTYSNIYNWNSQWNVLFTHLLDNPPSLTTQITTNLWSTSDLSHPSDFWAKRRTDGSRVYPGIKLGQWTDDPGGIANGFTLTYVFNADQLDYLTQYAANGWFGFGFDPDCHFYNDGITFSLRTQPVPEPGTLILLGSGLLGLGLASRRRRRKL